MTVFCDKVAASATQTVACDTETLPPNSDSMNAVCHGIPATGTNYSSFEAASQSADLTTRSPLPSQQPISTDRTAINGSGPFAVHSMGSATVVAWNLTGNSGTQMGQFSRNN